MPEKVNYNPDILSCLANLSSDEVFTPPEIANSMLDMLPQELFKSPDTKFLDPGCKSGVFLREIAKRLNEGLKDKIPDVEQRMDHIMKNQLFAIAITQITGLMSRRSVYCSKDASSRFSITRFENSDGNIRYRRIEHTWENGRCAICGASKDVQDRGEELESHAYEFIHMDKTTEKELKDMKFDVIIGNPPYQMEDGGAQASAIPIYNKFINQAKKLNPRYISMIVPSRWMTGGKGLDAFREEMIHSNNIYELHDFADSKDCFHGVDIKGGVCYFLIDNNYHGKCRCFRHSINGISDSYRSLCEKGNDIFIREPTLVSILFKVQSKKEQSLSSIVSARKPYALAAETMRNAKKYGLPEFSETAQPGGYRILGLGENQRRTWKFLPNNYPIPRRDSGLMKYKVFIAEAYGCGEIGEIPSTPVLSTPVLSKPGELCTETFLQIGPFDTQMEAENMLSYIRTKFFRALVGIKKQTQHTTQKVYQFVPMQDFSKPWTDKELYMKYGLSENEIEFIESNIKPMDIDGGADA